MQAISTHQGFSHAALRRLCLCLLILFTLTDALTASHVHTVHDDIGECSLCLQTHTQVVASNEPLFITAMAKQTLASASATIATSTAPTCSTIRGPPAILYS